MGDDGELALNCRHCQHPRTKCYRTKRDTDLTTRYILCEKCGKTDVTVERFAISTYAGTYAPQSVSDLRSDPDPDQKSETDQKAYVHIATTLHQSEQKRRQAEEHPGFDQAWQLYRKKVAKDAAIKAWNKIRPPLELVTRALGWQFQQPDWTKDNYRFAPNFSTYLHAGRWKDEPPRKPTGNGNSASGLPSWFKSHVEELQEEVERKRLLAAQSDQSNHQADQDRSSQ